MTLPAGKYLFERDAHNMAVARILSADRKHLYATLLTMPATALTPSDKPVITLDERPASLPAAVRAWFYPGETWGQEFMYRRNTDTRLADARSTTGTMRPESDKAIASEVAKQIRQYPLYSIFDEVEGSV